MGNSSSRTVEKEYPQTADSITRNKQLFIKLLKEKYKRLYDTVQPVPYIRDRLYCVDRVFVEGGIEYKAGSWVPLDSYHSVFTNSQIKSERRIIIAEAGYGKSTLTLQYAYDWCNGIKESFLKDVEILLLLQLRQLGGVHSIYKAIKESLVPRNSQLTENNIQNVINTSTVVLILDGFDEYPDLHNIGTDVLKILLMEMFQKFEVILTTRYLPKQYSGVTKQLRLTGFDERARDEYIRKAVVGNNIPAADAIKRKLSENPILGDLCQVPLIFVIFAHMSHEDEDFQTFETVTSFFQCIIKCFHSHMRNKMKGENVLQYELYERDHRTLDEVAFQGLSKKNQQIVWRREVLRDRLGHGFYDQYIRIGILVEEYVFGHSDGSGISTSDQYNREVRFYHKLFCEWYAAHYLAECVDELDFENLKRLVKNMDPLDLQYCYRFACGLNNAAGGKIIQYVKKREGGDKFAVLCLLETGGQVDYILDIVKELCSTNIEFNYDENKIIQRSLVQLLHIASTHEIPISHLRLYNCYCTVDLYDGNHLHIESNLSIPVLTTLNKLTITEHGREIAAEEFSAILQYSSKCLALKQVWFFSCLLPRFAHVESVPILRSRNVDVMMCPSDKEYRLNLRTCLWELIEPTGRVRREMTDADYLREVKAMKPQNKYHR